MATFMQIIEWILTDDEPEIAEFKALVEKTYGASSPGGKSLSRSEGKELYRAYKNLKTFERTKVASIMRDRFPAFVVSPIGVTGKSSGQVEKQILNYFETFR